MGGVIGRLVRPLLRRGYLVTRGGWVFACSPLSLLAFAVVFSGFSSLFLSLLFFYCDSIGPGASTVSVDLLD